MWDEHLLTTESKIPRSKSPNHHINFIQVPETLLHSQHFAIDLDLVHITVPDTFQTACSRAMKRSFDSGLKKKIDTAPKELEIPGGTLRRNAKRVNLDQPDGFFQFLKNLRVLQNAFVKIFTLHLSILIMVHHIHQLCHGLRDDRLDGKRLHVLA